MHSKVNILILFLIIVSSRCSCDDTISSSTLFSQKNIEVSEANIIAILYVRSRLACGIECDRNDLCAAFSVEKKQGIVTDGNAIICIILQEQPHLNASGSTSVYIRVSQSEKINSPDPETTPVPEATSATGEYFKIDLLEETLILPAVIREPIHVATELVQHQN